MEREFRLNWTLLVEEAVRRRHGLNLTQKQLAALAKVSTPTISRFEQNDKDIQLSTVLAILDVLGMTDRRSLVFADQEFYDDGKIGGVGGIIFWGQDGERRVRCHILRTALEDNFSDRDRLRPDAAFRKYRSDIEALARRKYLLGQLEPDGSIQLENRDLI